MPFIILNNSVFINSIRIIASYEKNVKNIIDIVFCNLYSAHVFLFLKKLLQKIMRCYIIPLAMELGVVVALGPLTPTV